MKTLLLAAAAILPLLAFARAPAEAPRVEDPPVECPFCGGNVALHALVIQKMTSTGAEAGRRLVVAVLG